MRPEFVIVPEDERPAGEYEAWENVYAALERGETVFIPTPEGKDENWAPRAATTVGAGMRRRGLRATTRVRDRDGVRGLYVWVRHA